MAVYRSSAVCYNSGWDEGCLLQLGTYYFWVDSFDVVRFKDGEPTSDTDGSPLGGGGGETNTASNIGGAVGVFKQKSGVDLEFKTLTSGSNLVHVFDDVDNDRISLDVRNDLPVWNAGSIHGNVVSSGTPADGQILRWDDFSGQWIYDDEASGPTYTLKRGIALQASFSGTGIKKYTVIFSTPYVSSNYSVTATPVTSGNAHYLVSIEDKEASGFVINAGTNNINKLVEVDWQTISV